MINRDMELYYVYEYDTNKDAYGQFDLNKEAECDYAQMAIYLTSQSIQDNINYKNATYVGFTYYDFKDTHIIGYKDKFLKVLYVNPQGRLNQVFMSEV